MNIFSQNPITCWLAHHPDSGHYPYHGAHFSSQIARDEDPYRLLRGTLITALGLHSPHANSKQTLVTSARSQGFRIYYVDIIRDKIIRPDDDDDDEGRLIHIQLKFTHRDWEKSEHFQGSIHFNFNQSVFSFNCAEQIAFSVLKGSGCGHRGLGKRNYCK